ncbi:Patatin-like phospholipase [Legionella massiliensis]|uniref:Patatin-like phospholipase n=1 Tax=Legionella massiliensis TaxID=1034943 RepID=A0A078L1Q4_9GAMM|nr:patatin-like phospholipase family protein [Legionella massiliensis]CDZ77948.1 Patatin-like phospholipase [Legionella massiliensis]CEE13686.1 Patatin-like phospholipase [Legionella massiliensis]
MTPEARLKKQLAAQKVRERPSFFSSSKSISDTAAAPPLEEQQAIERLVFSGGGAKGVVYPGSYEALLQTGILKGVKEISGSSAGAITAALIAIGMPSKQLRDQLLSTNFQDLLGEPVWSILDYFIPGCIKPAGVSFITKDGSGILNFIRENIDATLTQFFKDNAEDINAIDDERLNSIAEKMLEQPARITFGDLAVLNQYWPETFKKLTMPAVRHPSGEVQVFSCDETPNVEIALACRASASIPALLEPVEIDLGDGSPPYRYVDGGLFDNLPTDYFDRDEETGAFIKNQKPQQTLVFAFGEGLNNQENQVYQALYGHRWDEVLTSNLLATLFKSTAELIEADLDEDGPLMLSNIKERFKPALFQVLKEFVAQTPGQDSRRAANLVMQTSMKKLEDITNDWQNYPDIFQEKSGQAITMNLRALAELIEEEVAPVLYKAGFIEQIKRNELVSTIGEMNTEYKNTEQKELGFQKLRSEYPLRTVELRVGNIKTTDFDEASKHARVMDALGYLDSINHFTNHDLEDPESFNTDQFYVELVHNFEQIYSATLQGSNKDLAKDELLNSLEKLQSQLANREKPATAEVIGRQLYQVIKDQVEQNFDSAAAFALSRAVEFNNGNLNAEQLFKETYEEAFRRTPFAISNFAGERFFSAKSLHAALAEQNMFDLYQAQDSHNENSRHEKIFSALSGIEAFETASQTHNLAPEYSRNSF